MPRRRSQRLVDSKQQLLRRPCSCCHAQGQLHWPARAASFHSTQLLRPLTGSRRERSYGLDGNGAQAIAERKNARQMALSCSDVDNCIGRCAFRDFGDKTGQLVHLQTPGRCEGDIELQCAPVTHLVSLLCAHAFVEYTVQLRLALALRCQRLLYSTLDCRLQRKLPRLTYELTQVARPVSARVTRRDCTQFARRRGR